MTSIQFPHLIPFVLFLSALDISHVETKNDGSENFQLDVIKYAIIFRHGLREQIDHDFEIAQLLNQGKDQGFNLGIWLRNRYPEVLNNNYNYKEIYCISSDVDRVLMTSEAVLAGLYHPLSFKDRWKPNLEWTPVPVHTSAKEYDEVMYQERQRYCPKMGEILAHKVNYLKDKYPLIMNFYITERKLNFEDQGSVFIVIKTLDKSLPNINGSIKEEFNKDVEKLLQDPAWLKFETGPKFGTIFDQWEEENRKVVLLGGHDISIWNCIVALGFDQPENIDFISSIIFEMHSVKNDTSEEIFIKVIFKNGPDAETQVKIIKGCTELCPYDKFVKILGKLIPKDWRNECEI